MTYPDLKKAEELAAMGLYHTMPVSMEMFSDMYTPVGVLRKLKNVSEHCYMLESAEDAKRWGRYSFLGFEPTLEISCRNGMPVSYTHLERIWTGCFKICSGACVQGLSLIHI